MSSSTNTLVSRQQARHRRPENVLPTVGTPSTTSGRRTEPFVRPKSKDRRSGSRSPSRPARVRKQPVTGPLPPSSGGGSRPQSPSSRHQHRRQHRREGEGGGGEPDAVQTLGDRRRSQLGHVTAGKRDRGRSQQSISQRPVKKLASLESVKTNGSEAPEPQVSYQGPLALAHMERLRSENEALRKQLSDARKDLKGRTKLIVHLQDESAAQLKAKNEQGQQLEKLKGKSKQDDELIATLESACACQICMEALLQPFCLTPCGHAFCLGCLQSWFRSAPLGADEMQDDGPDALLFRRKTCPTCRTVVRARPVPLFSLRTVTVALVRARQAAAGQSPKRDTPPLADGDPWEGIFHEAPETSESEDDGIDIDDDDDSELFDEDEDGAEARSSDEEGDDDEDEDSEDAEDNEHDEVYGYGTGSDEEPYEGAYVDSRWEPPSVWLDPAVYELQTLSHQEMSLLRRGATLAMADIYRLRYSHERGIVARMQDSCTIHLGWNVSLHPHDATGEEYMRWVRSDMEVRSERWRIQERPWTAWRLVTEEEADEEYQTTDSEHYNDLMQDD